MSDASMAAFMGRLGELSRALDAKQHTLHDAELAAVHARRVADVERHKAILAGEGAVELRKSQAAVLTADLETEAAEKEALARLAWSELRNVRSQVEVGRSLLSSVKAEMSNFPGAA